MSYSKISYHRDSYGWRLILHFAKINIIYCLIHPKVFGVLGGPAGHLGLAKSGLGKRWPGMTRLLAIRRPHRTSTWHHRKDWRKWVGTPRDHSQSPWAKSIWPFGFPFCLSVLRFNLSLSNFRFNQPFGWTFMLLAYILFFKFRANDD